MERQGGWLPGDLVVAGLGEAVLELGDVDVLAPGFFALARGLEWAGGAGRWKGQPWRSVDFRVNMCDLI